MKGRFTVCLTQNILEPFRSKYLHRYTIGHRTIITTFNNVIDAFNYIVHDILENNDTVVITSLMQYSIYDNQTGQELLSTDNNTYRTPSKTDNINKERIVPESFVETGKVKTNSFGNKATVHRILQTQVTGCFDLTINNTRYESTYRKVRDALETDRYGMIYKALINKYSINSINDMKRETTKELINKLKVVHETEHMVFIGDNRILRRKELNISKKELYEIAYCIQTYKMFEKANGFWLIDTIRKMFGKNIETKTLITRLEPLSQEIIERVYNTKTNNYNPFDRVIWYRPQHSGRRHFKAINKATEYKEYIRNRDRTHYTENEARLLNNHTSEIYKNNRSWKEKYKTQNQWCHRVESGRYSETLKESPETKLRKEYKINNKVDRDRRIQASLDSLVFKNDFDEYEN